MATTHSRVFLDCDKQVLTARLTPGIEGVEANQRLDVQLITQLQGNDAGRMSEICLVVPSQLPGIEGRLEQHIQALQYDESRGVQAVHEVSCV